MYINGEVIENHMEYGENSREVMVDYKEVMDFAFSWWQCLR